MKLLFARQAITNELPFDWLTALLPGWELATCAPDQLAGNLDGVTVLCPLGAFVTADVMKAGSFGLVHQFGVGLERVDVAAATDLGILVARVPGDAGGNADSCAELAVLDLLALARRLDEARAAASGGHWFDRPMGMSLLGATVLIVGLGAIGTAVARRLAPFGARLLAVRADPAKAGPPEVDLVAGPDRLPDLLAQADAVVCCAMLHAGNERLFGAREFAAMRPGSLFVNVARGGLIDEAALLDALESGQVGGAGLDVFAAEPADGTHPLVRHPRVIATPHVAWYTGMMFRRSGEAFAANLRRYQTGAWPHWTVNEPAFRR
ncbi:MAG TPA: NAD(P)-dependent oxidoreductase [Streptosporangiaceae bacterium]